jgi:hypothetical protein
MAEDSIKDLIIEDEMSIKELMGTMETRIVSNTNCVINIMNILNRQDEIRQKNNDEILKCHKQTKERIYRIEESLRKLRNI